MERALADELEDVARERQAAGAAPDADAHGTRSLSQCLLALSLLAGWLAGSSVQLQQRFVSA
eukprot:scaffold67528_cov72-Phaeocystis_antarctica.AAC.4